MEIAGTILLVGLGGAIGGVLRAIVMGAFDRPGGIPWGTLFVNVTGSGAAGFGAALALAGVVGGSTWAWAGMGALGSYTTVSAFTLQAQGLAARGKGGLALGYVAVSVALCLLAASLGGGIGMAVAA